MPRLLLVEDDPLLAKVYRARFMHHGYEVEVATDGESALERVATFQPQAVLLDIMLPGMNGLEVLGRLRGNVRWRELPVIVFSNHFHEHDAVAATKAGATAVLSKSEDGPDVVLECVRTAIAGPPPKALTAVQESATSGPDAFLLQQVRSCLGPLTQSLSVPGTLRHKRALVTESTQVLHLLSGFSGIGGWGAIGALASAAEALATHLTKYPNLITASCERTLYSAVSRLHELLVPVVKRVRDISGIYALVLDDDSVSRSTAQFALAKAKLASDLFSEPEAALAALPRRRYGLIATDVMMGAMSGLKFAERLRQLPNYRDTPILFVTGAAEFDKLDLARFGQTDVIAKPFLFMELATKAIVQLVRPV